MANETSNGVSDALLSAAIAAGVSAVGWILSGRRYEQHLRQDNARTAQQLADHVLECDRRYKEMAEKQAERHSQNQAELRAVVDTNRRVEDKLDNFVKLFVRIGGA